MVSKQAFKGAASLFVLLFLFVLTQWSNSVYLPIAPKLVGVFGGHAQLITSSVSVFFAGYAIGQIFWGILSDFIGRYSALILASLLYIVFESLIAFAGINALYFVVFLAVVGFAASANTAVGNALIKDRYGKRAKVIIAYVGVAMSIAPAVAPMLGSALYSHWGWQSVFAFLAGVCIVLLVCFSVLFKPSKQLSPKACSSAVSSEDRLSLWRMVTAVFSNKSLMGYSLILAITFGVFMSLLLIVPFILESKVHYSVEKVGFIMFGVAGSCALGSIANFVLIKRKDPVVIVRLGLLLVLLGGIVFLINTVFMEGLVSSVSLVAAAIAVLGVGAALPAAKAGAMMSATENVGTSASVMKFTQSLGCVVLTQIASLSIGADAIEGFLMAVVVLSAVLVVYSRLMPFKK